ncbi:hypothetical protein [Cumulibacter manganitolerans]|uniref:hypothetical protein n=1 Tax=Cumulibacter manganitolerans TaxID=1884992 RepID=UPI001297010E|nr:hypothetical protein [Cumulibacter manganitolerans]
MNLRSRWVGVEQEFRLVDRMGTVDARELWPRLPLDGRRLDPGDPNAVRCRWGGVLTTDGAEAELATPPVTISPQGIARTVGLAQSGRTALETALPNGTRAEGYSTHLNIEVDDRRVIAVARRVARTVAPVVMLLLDGAASPGLLVRPRYRRLELGGEYQTGPRLGGTLALATAAALAIEGSGRRRLRSMPELDVRLQSSPQRFGWYVDRRAFGGDLYATGRSTRLTRVSGGTLSAQELLENTWGALRATASGLAPPPTIALLDAVVGGELPLPIELSGRPDPCDAGPSCVPESRVADVLTTRRRGPVSLTPVAATWHSVAWRAEYRGRSRWVIVPAKRVPQFADALDAGRLDRWLVGRFRPVPSWTGR